MHRQFEAERALTRDACELFNQQAVVRPKHRRAITEGLIVREHSAPISLPDNRIGALPAAVLSPTPGTRPRDWPADRG